MFPTIAILGWPVVVIILFQKLERPAAVAISIIAAYLLLPVEGGIDLPLLPPIDKNTVAVIAALTVAWQMSRTDIKATVLDGWLPRHTGLRILIFVAVASAMLTVVFNGDQVSYGPVVLPGLRLYDAFSAMMGAALMMLPLILARKYLAHPEQHVLLLTILCVAGLCYSLLALYEVRMSPQLNRMVYGFFPHSWAQHLRGNGFRPIVFLSHGLQLAIFFTGTIIAACALMRIHAEKQRMLYLCAALWLFMTLVLAKSIGALAIALLLVPIAALLSVRMQMLAAAVLTILVVSYPLSRGAGWVPIERIQSIATQIDPQRGASLGTRLQNEEAMLEKASVRPLFGWGRWGRSRIYDENGRDISIADGYWAISIGVGGWVKFLSEFLLLGGAVVLLALRQRIYNIGMETSALALIVAGWMVDLLPNSALTPLLWLVAGALWGRVELGKIAQTADAPETQEVTPRIRYSRQSHKNPVPDRQVTYARAKPEPRKH